MEDEQNLTYFFDDIVNYMRVAGEVFELYAEYITKSKSEGNKCIVSGILK